MTQLSRERIEQYISDPLEYGLTRSEQMEMARRLLAAEAQEPVAFRAQLKSTIDPEKWSYISHRKPDAFEIERCNIEFLYAAPQPVAVPDERYQHLNELYHAQEKRLFKIAQRIKGPSFDKYAYSPSQAIDVLEEAIFGMTIEDGSAVRAAMLQGKADKQASCIPHSASGGAEQRFFAAVELLKRAAPRMLADESLAAMLQGKADGTLTNEGTKQVGELVMWIKRLAHSLRKANPDGKLQSDAMDYLSRNGFIGVEDVLR